MRLLRLRQTTTRPASATAYAAGDEISDNATAGSVTRATFDLSGFRQGRILYAELDLTAASGNVVTTASNMEILLFRTGEAPAAVGDNTTMPLTAAQRASAVAGFLFDDTGWTGPLGTVAAGTSQYSNALPTLVQPIATPVTQYPYQPGYVFRLDDVAAKTLTVVIRALAAWTPTGIINTFGITLNIEAE